MIAPPPVNFRMLQGVCVDAEESQEVGLRLIEVEWLKREVVVLYAIENASLIWSTAELTGSVLQQRHTVFARLVEEVLHRNLLTVSVAVRPSVRKPDERGSGDTIKQLAPSSSYGLDSPLRIPYSL
jgi:hypothetical protein